MPYIKQEDRRRLDMPLDHLIKEIKTEGEFNYCMTRLAHGLTKTMGLKYATLNAVVGAFQSAMTEYQRRIVGPYEDTKIKENGDV